MAYCYWTDLTWMDKVSKKVITRDLRRSLLCVCFHGDSSVDGDVMDMSLAMMGGFFPGGTIDTSQSNSKRKERCEPWHHTFTRKPNHNLKTPNPCLPRAGLDKKLVLSKRADLVFLVKLYAQAIFDFQKKKSSCSNHLFIWCDVAWAILFIKPNLSSALTLFAFSSPFSPFSLHHHHPSSFHCNLPRVGSTLLKKKTIS